MTQNEIFSEDFIETTFLYCYKRLSNHTEAQDLAQEILVEGLSVLRSGREIVSFYSWYWQMAHNKYVQFLKKRAGESISLEVWGGSIPSELPQPEDGLIEDEEINALNYSISRLSAMQRQIVVMRFLGEMKVKDIAAELGIPEGTVKRRLFDAKENIKKGMENEMKNIGKFAYAPAEVDFMGGYNIVRHWDNMSDRLAKQIFVICYKNGATLQEIADSIGVAPLYFEEKLQYMLDNKFMKQVGEKYYTDFCMIPKQSSCDLTYEVSLMYEDLAPKLHEGILALKDEITKLDFYGNDFPYEYLMWILYVYAGNGMGAYMRDSYSKKWEGKIAQNNGKDYRLMATYALPDRKIVSKPVKMTGWSNLHHGFKTPLYTNVQYANLFEAHPFLTERDDWVTDKNILLLMELYENPAMELVGIEEEQVAAFIANKLVVKRDGGYYLNVPVMTFEIKKKIEQIICDKLSPMADEYVEAIAKLGEKHYLPHVREDLMEEYVHWVMEMAFMPMGSLMYYGIYEAQTLAIPADFEKSAAGLCMYIQK